jgi:hypothetical protein
MRSYFGSLCFELSRLYGKWGSEGRPAQSGILPASTKEALGRISQVLFWVYLFPYHPGL